MLYNVHKAPCVEERSAFLQNTPIFHFFLQKNTPISFPAYGPVDTQTIRAYT